MPFSKSSCLFRTSLASFGKVEEGPSIARSQRAHRVSRIGNNHICQQRLLLTPLPLPTPFLLVSKYSWDFDIIGPFSARKEYDITLLVIFLAKPPSPRRLTWFNDKWMTATRIQLSKTNLCQYLIPDHHSTSHDHTAHRKYISEPLY